MTTRRRLIKWLCLHINKLMVDGMMIHKSTQKTHVNSNYCEQVGIIYDSSVLQITSNTMYIKILRRVSFFLNHSYQQTSLAFTPLSDNTEIP